MKSRFYFFTFLIINRLSIVKFDKHPYTIIPHKNLNFHLIYDNAFIFKHNKLINDEDEVIFNKNDFGYTITVNKEPFCFIDDEFKSCNEPETWMIESVDKGFIIKTEKKEDILWFKVDDYCLEFVDSKAKDFAYVTLAPCTGEDKQVFHILRKKEDKGGLAIE